MDLYVEYLKSGVAQKSSLELIKGLNNKIFIENVGGSAYRTLSRVLKKLNISKNFEWFNTEEDPFFHSIGKYNHTPKAKRLFMIIQLMQQLLQNIQAVKNSFP